MDLQADTIVELIDIAKVNDAQQPSAVKLRRRHPRLRDESILASIRIATGIGNFGLSRNTAVLDISAGGLQFIWTGFVHSSTQFSVQLQRPGGSPFVVEASCVWCKHLRNRFHAVGAQTKAPIPLHDIISPQLWLEICAQNPELQHPVNGRMSVFGEASLTVQSALFQVRDSGLTVQTIDNRGALMDLIERAATDIIVADADPESLDATEFIAACRGRSFIGPIILMSMDRETEYAAQMDPLRRSRFVHLPMTTNAIVAAVRDVVRDHPDCILEAREIYSKSPHTRHRDEALRHFISLAKTMCDEARHAMDAGRLEAVTKVVQSLAASGGSHGYEELSLAAMRYLSSASDPKQQKRLPSLLQGIQTIVERLRAGDPSKATA